jgi:hypothetical protein
MERGQEMKDKIAEIIYAFGNNSLRYSSEGADKILALFKNIQVEVDCPAKCDKGAIYYGSQEEGWDQEPCPRCQGTGKTTRSATFKEMEKGGILDVAK